VKVQPDQGGRFQIGPPPPYANGNTTPYNYSFEIVGLLGEPLAEITVSCDGVTHTVNVKPHASRVVVEER